jgi:hypothetical protein
LLIAAGIPGTFRKRSLIWGFAKIPQKKLEFPSERFHAQRFLVIIAKSSRLLASGSASARVCSCLLASVRIGSPLLTSANLAISRTNLNQVSQ